MPLPGSVAAATLLWMLFAIDTIVIDAFVAHKASRGRRFGSTGARLDRLGGRPIAQWSDDGHIRILDAPQDVLRRIPRHLLRPPVVLGTSNAGVDWVCQFKPGESDRAYKSRCERMLGVLKARSGERGAPGALPRLNPSRTVALNRVQREMLEEVPDSLLADEIDLAKKDITGSGDGLAEIADWLVGEADDRSDLAMEAARSSSQERMAWVSTAASTAHLAALLRGQSSDYRDQRRKAEKRYKAT